jgi:hypothetical protein
MRGREIDPRLPLLGGHMVAKRFRQNPELHAHARAWLVVIGAV